MSVIQQHDLCPECHKDKLRYAYANEPYTSEHLWCQKCNSTFTLKQVQLWMDDVNNIASEVCDFVEYKLQKRKYKLRGIESDKIFDMITDILDVYSTGDYKNHN